MANMSHVEELAHLRNFLARLEHGRLTMSRGLVDETKSEIGLVRRDIAFLEEVLTRLEAEAAT
jgi:hypothetical protein